MAVGEYDISHVRLAGTIKIWDFYYMPVYEIEELNSREKMEQWLISGKSYTYGNTSINSGLPLVTGTMEADLNESLSIQRGFRDEPITNEDIIISETEFSGSGTLFKRVVRARNGSGVTSSNVVYIDPNESSFDFNKIESVWWKSSELEGLNFYSFNGGCGGFIRFIDTDNNYKYVRVFIGIILLSGTSDNQEPVFTVSRWGTGINQRGYNFYGCLANTILSLDSIGDGKFTFEEGPHEPETPDPLDPIGPSGPGGGGGNFDQNSDIIGDSSLPTISAADTGFTRIYSPTLSQVQDLAQYLWTDETVVETIWNKIKQLLENPMDAIISFSLVPVPVQISGTKNFALAYIDTGVAMNTVANQFVDVDCGTFELKEYYGSALDYSPNTKVSCFLPFIGVVTLNTDEVMNTTLNVKYRVDIVSGSCVSKIFVNESCLYQYSGHCSIPIPISAADFSSYLAAAIGVAKLAIGAAVGGGAGAAAAGASEVDVSQATSGAVDSKNTGEQSILEYAFSNDPASSQESSTQPTRASFDGISAKNITNVVGTVMGSKLHVEHSGSFSGNTGYLGVRRPYLIIQRPRMCMPNEYRSYNGYPSMITLNIGDCKGYTKVQQVQLKNIPATNPEQSEIMQLLKGGIII